MVCWAAVRYAMGMREGVIKFDLAHESGALRQGEREAVVRMLGWRGILQKLELLGADAARYDGLGFGNISHRCGPRSAPRGARAFVVSGTQTSGHATATVDHFAVVTRWRVRDNAVVSRGPVRPSSEALTHATIFDEAPHAQCVLHVHSPLIWAAQRSLCLPATPAGIDYGTVEMADATAALFLAGRVAETGLFVMLGHEDGVVAFGRTVDEAGSILVRALAAASGP